MVYVPPRFGLVSGMLCATLPFLGRLEWVVYGRPTQPWGYSRVDCVLPVFGRLAWVSSCPLPLLPTPTHPPYLFRDSRVGRVLPTPSWKNFGRVMSPTYACVGHIRVDRVLTYFGVLSVRWCPTRLWNTLG